MATIAQVNEFNLHRIICQALNISQSTLKHRSMTGNVTLPDSSSSPTAANANRIYTASPARNIDDEPTEDTLVWFVQQPQRSRSGDEGRTARMSEPRLMGQLPTIDDNGNVLDLMEEDWIEDPQGTKFRITNPAMGPDMGFYFFDLEEQR